MHIGRAGCHDHSVRIYLLHQLRRHRRVQMDLRTAGHGLSDIPLEVQPHVFLKACHRCVIQKSTQPVGLLIQGDPVTHFPQRLCRHHAAGATPDHHHMFFLTGLYQCRQIQVLAQHGINGAAHGGTVVVGIAAPVAAGAGAHILGMAPDGFMNQVFIGHICLRHNNDVSLSCADDLLRLLQRGDIAYHRHRNLQPFLCLCRKGNIQLPPLKIGGNGVSRTIIEEDVAPRNMDDIHILLCPLHKLQRFLQLESVRRILLCRAPTFDHHIRHGLPHRLQHRQREPHPIFKAAAVGVRPVVRGRRQELCQKVIVGTVDHNNLETGLLAAHGAVHKLLTHKGHIFLVHRLDVPQGPTIQRHIRGCKRRVAGGGIASPACMRQLHTHFCAILSGRTRHHL